MAWKIKAIIPQLLVGGVGYLELWKIFSGRSLDELYLEELTTIFCDCESLVNSRSLTYYYTAKKVQTC